MNKETKNNKKKKQSYFKYKNIYTQICVIYKFIGQPEPLTAEKK